MQIVCIGDCWMLFSAELAPIKFAADYFFSFLNSYIILYVFSGFASLINLIVFIFLSF